MSSAALDISVPRGAYPGRIDPRRDGLDRPGAAAAAPLLRGLRARARRWNRFVARVAAHGPALAGLGEPELRASADELRLRLRREGFQDDLVARVFALVREAAGRELGQRHFDVQLVGGRVLLSGMVAE